MPTRTSAAPGAPTWIDLTSSDVAMARRFYSELFGWTAGDADEQYGSYFMFFSDGVPVAGCMQAGADDTDGWAVYLATDDIEKTVETATTGGGTVVVPPMPVGDVGTMALVTDPSGATIGAWQPGTFFGFPTYAESGKPGWWELHTRDYAAVLPFYRSVFGWETQSMGDTDDFRYSVLQVGDMQAAGVMDASRFLGEGEASHWSVYIAVDDADAGAGPSHRTRRIRRGCRRGHALRPDRPAGRRDRRPHPAARTEPRTGRLISAALAHRRL